MKLTLRFWQGAWVVMMVLLVIATAVILYYAYPHANQVEALREMKACRASTAPVDPCLKAVADKHGYTMEYLRDLEKRGKPAR